MNLSRLKSKIQKLPQTSGVYVFKNKNGDVVYVGKAANLRSRAGSYFRNIFSFEKGVAIASEHSNRGDFYENVKVKNPSVPTGHLPFTKGENSRPIEMMIREVADVKTIETESVLEALILEANLIKKYQPKYNVKEKDDKSFSYFVITKEIFPRVIIVRGTELDVQISNNQFPTLPTGRQVSNKIPKLKSRIKRNMSDTKYRIQHTKIFGPYTSKKQMEIALKIMRKIFPFHSSRQKTEKGCLDFQIGNCPGPYAGEISRADYLKNIRGIKMILEGKKNNLVKKLEKEMKELAEKHEFEKAGEVRNKIYALQHMRDVALMTREFNEEELRIKNYELSGNKFKIHPPRRTKFKILRVEAYDISNISGQYATGSMVVFDNSETAGNADMRSLQPNKSEYRKFKIKTISGIDDVGMMRGVLLRRFNNDWPLPDLILLDGGIGHLNMAAAVLRSLDLNIPLAAVAKGPERKSAELRITNYELSDRIQNILNNKKLIKQIMDEAHRFAVGYHRKLRKKSFGV